MRKMIVELKIVLEIVSDESIELSEIMDDVEYNIGSTIAEVTPLEESYEILDSK